MLFLSISKVSLTNRCKGEMMKACTIGTFLILFFFPFWFIIAAVTDGSKELPSNLNLQVRKVVTTDLLVLVI